MYGIKKEVKQSTVRSVIVYGPQGCGKSLAAPKLIKRFGLHTKVEADDMERGEKFAEFGVLYLTFDERTAVKSKLARFDFLKLQKDLK